MTITDRWFGVRGKVAVVFGATPIGSATANILESAGSKAILIQSTAENPKSGIEPDDEIAVSALLDRTITQNGKIDIMVYAASLPGAFSFKSTSLEQWDRMHDVNLRGAFVAMRETVKRMSVTGGGRIIAVSTMGSLHPVLNGNAAYCSSKAGLNALVRSVALDHVRDNILVNAVLPGAVPVGPMPADAPVPTGPACEPGRLILGMASADEVAAAILFLASPAGRFITGQALALDGGFLIS